MLYSGTTVAFSTKANVWKTRYSFAPTCYMTMSNDFMSSSLTSISSINMAWKHDVSTQYNRFYDRNYPSSLEVVSNDNPSAVKIFKSLSIESNATDWTGSVYTNKDRGMTALQVGDFSAFTEKEGNQYNAIPRSRINSTSNLTFIGVVELQDIVPSTYNDDGSYEIPLINTPEISIPSAPNGSFGFFGNDISTLIGGDTIIGFEAFNFSTTVSTSSSSGASTVDALRIIRYNDSLGSITVRSSAAATPLLLLLFTQSLQANNDGTVPVYILTDPVENGDVMRGPYAGVNLTLDNASQPFELFAINVDYEKTKLDGSLG